jgi:hypothetical protein
MTIGPDHTQDPINDRLRAAHIATGEPRYSLQMDRLGGGYVRRWSNDRGQALQWHRDAAADPKMKAVFCFDHIAIDMLAFDFAAD